MKHYSLVQKGKSLYSMRGKSLYSMREEKTLSLLQDSDNILLSENRITIKKKILQDVIIPPMLSQVFSKRNDSPVSQRCYNDVVVKRTVQSCVQKNKFNNKSHLMRVRKLE